MPMISIRCPCGECPPEWAMIELQGSVEIQPSALHRELHTLTIGTLCARRPGDKFIFNVGYHELEGSMVTLKKPMVVVKKKEPPCDGAVDEDSASGGGRRVAEAELEVVATIRKKLLFKNRPKALISRPEAKSKGKAKSEH